MPAKAKYVVVAVVSVALIAGTLAYDIIKAKPAEVVAAPVEEEQKPIVVAEEPKAEPEPVQTPEPVAPSWHYYNLDIQDNGIAADDFNFGPPPQVNDAGNLDQELRLRMKEDPALGAADMAWADAVLGTRYLGVFYSECDEEWDAAINKAKESWISDKEKYDTTLESFFRHLDRATKEVREEKGLTDQMYMNPDTPNGVPDVIVLETEDHTGKFLVYTFEIKGKKVELKYRLDCGYQPTNVAEVMKVTPSKKVVNPGGKTAIVGGGKSGAVISGGGGKGGGSNPKPNPPGPKPTPPGPKPTPTPKPKKDPTKGTPVLPNDDPGPGPNTNTGPGGQYSSKDLPGNSNDLTPDEYRKIIEQMNDANQPGGDSQPGDAPNNPSTPTPPDTPVDNNGDTGTGNGSINDPTPVDSGSVGNDPPADSWDGPPDA